MKYTLKAKSVLLYFILFFALDFFNKDQLNVPENVLWVVKSIKMIFLTLFSFILISEKNINFLKKIGFLVALIVIHQGLLLQHHSDLVIQSLFQTIREMLLYCFPIVFATYINTVNQNQDKVVLSILFEIIILIVATTTIVGFFFSIPYFKTYYARFGYLGVLPKSITATYFYISAILYTYQYREKNFYLKALFFLTVFASLLVGTKGIYLFLVIFTSYLFYILRWYKEKLFYSVALFFMLFFWFYKETLILTLRKVFHTIEVLYHEKGLLSALSSYRSDIFCDLSKKYQPTWEWYNYLVGGRISNYPIYEMTIVDLVVSFGIIGMIYYLYTVYLLMSVSNSHQSRFLNFSLCSVFIISIFAGQFFINISAISYVTLALFLINCPTNRNQINESK
ncbi:hypothetical protein KIH23_09465 [Flavobacterium sp. CYK-55]|uniref:hypothetical protein n=1 Tax=Flavobacterium sp. CYK-55 TaxID=2835529 RepID=UPI001BD0091A|nr:hypothetical protein [Flavobacterium sp. CYK-55]MBS7787523.1 hypothetical protein [Flavobacterium sp. CYK-55]